MRRFFSFWMAALVVIGLALAPAAHAQAPAQPDCSNPRSATDSLLVWLGGPSHNPDQALTCVDLPEGMNGASSVVQLKQILDARALFVPIPSMPIESDYTDESGQHRIAPMPDQAPWLVIERDSEGSWRYSASTMAQVPALYDATFSSWSRNFQEMLPEVLHEREPLFGMLLWQYLYAFLVLLVAFIVAQVARVVVLSQLRRVVSRLDIRVDPSVLTAMNRPLAIFVVSATVLWALPDLQLPISISPTVYVAVSVVMSLAFVLVASRLVDVAAGLAEARADKTASRLDDQLVPMLRQAGRVAVWALGILFVLQNNGVQVWSLVAGLGIGSLAFALAAQDSIANLFGAMNIFLDKPFQIGDWVQIEEVEGIVEEVGFRTTKVRTFYNSLVTIPNSTITTTNVDNFGARHRRRIKLVLGLTYDTPADTLQAYVEGLRAILAAHPAVQRSYEVHFNNFGDSALEILVYYHVVVPSWTDELEAKAQTYLEFVRLAEALGVSFAFPSTSLYVESTPERPMAAAERKSAAELMAIAASFGPNGDRSRPDGVPFERSFSVQARQTEAGS